MNGEFKKFNKAPFSDALQTLMGFMECEKWARELANQRPFRSARAFASSAKFHWLILPDQTRIDALNRKPLIGDPAVIAKKLAGTASKDANEQAGMATATAELAQQIAEGNVAYREKFGFTYVICATGLSAEQLGGALATRLENDREKELETATEENFRIAEIRFRSHFAWNHWAYDPRCYWFTGWFVD